MHQLLNVLYVKTVFAKMKTKCIYPNAKITNILKMKNVLINAEMKRIQM